MPAMFDVIPTTLSAALTTGGTLTLNYPSGRNKGDYKLGDGHMIVWNGLQLVYPRDFTIALGTGTFVLTMVSAVTIPIGAVVYTQLNRAGAGTSSFDDALSLLAANAQKSHAVIATAPTVYWSLGAPAAASAASVSAAATPASIPTTVATALPLTIGGTLAVNGSAYPDVPRNVTVTSVGVATGHTIGVVGIDTYGNKLVEWITGGSTATTVGKKAFARVDGAYVWGTGAAVSLSVGFGAVFGIPLNIQATALIVKELDNGAVPTAGTFVAADNATATGTTGDTRGTWAPNSTPDGVHTFALIFHALNIDAGGPQFTGP